jgi:hypothetical protein
VKALLQGAPAVSRQDREIWNTRAERTGALRLKGCNKAPRKVEAS